MWAEIVTRLHINPENVLVVGGGTLAMMLTCLFSWFRGAGPDRIGATVFAMCWVCQTGTAYAHLWITGDIRTPMMADIVCSVVPGLVFLWLAVRHDNLWFGSVALFQGMQFALYAADQALHEPATTLLPLILISGSNLLNLAMMAAMFGSARSSHRRLEATSGPSPEAPSQPEIPAAKSDVGLRVLTTSGVRRVD